MKAWLVTWEWMGEHAKRRNKIAAVLNPHFSGQHVRELVQFLYTTESYTVSEQMAFAKDPTQNPYPAQFAQIEGHPWAAQIHCGHNPFLFARLVDELTVERGADGKENGVWKERPRPKLVVWKR